MNPQALAGKMNRKMRFLWQWNEIPEIPHFQTNPHQHQPVASVQKRKHMGDPSNFKNPGKEDS
jgi:hypothetical protein